MQCKQHATLNPQYKNGNRHRRIQSCLVRRHVENLTKNISHMVCLIWKFSRGGWRTAFLPRNTKCERTAIVFAHQSKTHIKEFWILILEYNNSLRAPWKRCAKIELKLKHGSKESWIKPNGHNRENLINHYTTIWYVCLMFFNRDNHC